VGNPLRRSPVSLETGFLPDRIVEKPGGTGRSEEPWGVRGVWGSATTGRRNKGKTKKGLGNIMQKGTSKTKRGDANKRTWPDWILKLGVPPRI